MNQTVGPLRGTVDREVGTGLFFRERRNALFRIGIPSPLMIGLLEDQRTVLIGRLREIAGVNLFELSHVVTHVLFVGLAQGRLELFEIRVLLTDINTVGVSTLLQDRFGAVQLRHVRHKLSDFRLLEFLHLGNTHRVKEY